MFIQPSIKLVVFPKKINSLGKATIFLQYIQNRKINRIGLKLKIDPAHWQNSNGKFVRERGANKPANGREINLYLMRELDRAEKIILDAVLKEQSLSFVEFKASFLDNQSADFYEYCEAFIDNRMKKGSSLETIKGYHSRLRKIRSFRPTLSLSQVDYHFLSDFDTYMSVELKNMNNTRWTALKFIKTVLRQAIREELIDKNPFDQFKISYQDNPRLSLTYDELGRLEQLWVNNTIKDAYLKVLRHFLFACHTGLDFGDTKQLDYKDIVLHKDQILIDRDRSKTNNRYVVALSNFARGLIDTEQSEGLVFDLASNQKTNQYLKEICSLVGIRKRISFHSARHTFGTLSINRGIPRSVVQRMMGHASERMTKHYSRISADYIVEEMRKWNE